MSAARELANFLTFGFAELDFQVRPSRQDLVLSLLKVLMEVFLGLKIPVVVAFDQLEDLLLARRGEDPATGQEIARAAAALIDKAERPASGETTPSRKDRRAAARARATAAPAWPRPDTQREEETSGGDAGLAAKVIPLGIFDPFEEAGKPW